LLGLHGGPPSDGAGRERMAAPPARSRAQLAEILSAASAAAAFLARALDDAGALHDRVGDGNIVVDLAAYYKAPTALLLAGRPADAHRVLDYVKATFATAEGSFETGGSAGKTANEALRMYRPYMDIWLAVGAARLGRPDVAQPVLQWARRFRHPELGGYALEPYRPDGGNGVDVLLTAHMGLAHLYVGELAAARAAADCLLALVDAQLEANGALGARFHLRLDDRSGKPQTDFPAELAPFYVVDSREPSQLYFMVGYPIAVFCKVYLASKDPRYLQAARQLADFCLTCHGSIFSFHYAHKVAWAAACLAGITGEEKYRGLALDIATYLVSIQDVATGGFLLDQKAYDSLDQTAEISMWLLEVGGELQSMQGAVDARKSA